MLMDVLYLTNFPHMKQIQHLLILSFYVTTFEQRGLLSRLKTYRKARLQSVNLLSILLSFGI
jgi:hypothetical protein